MLAAFIYARGVGSTRRKWPRGRTALFSLGLVAVLVALVSAIDFYAQDLFSIHMAQHMLLTVVAAPLLLLGQPVRPLLRGIPRSLRRAVRPIAANRIARAVFRVLRSPLVAGLLYVGGLYYWHLPPVYDAAVEDPLLHAVEHSWFLASALLFWSNIIDPAPFRAGLSYAPRIVYLLLAGAAQNTILGGLLAFSTRLLYRHYEGRPEQYGVSAVTDQRIGGATMWVPGDLIFLAAASLCFFLFLRAEETEQVRRESSR
jgi:cytochrome c oxidase assembly factor CtaG